jgi:hypothetical protein
MPRSMPLLLLALSSMALALGCSDPVLGPIGDYCRGENPGYSEGSFEAVAGLCPFSNEPCASDYESLPERAPEHAFPISEAELWDQLEQLRLGTFPLADGVTGPDELRAELLDAANLQFLLEELAYGELSVTEFDDVAAGPAIQRSFVIEDPFVGPFRGLALLPEGQGPFPTLVIAHGHEEFDQEWIDRYGGWELVERGYALFVPTLRVNDATQVEADVTLGLLREGFTMMALRVYETLLVARYAAALPHVDPCRIGLVGHSGGSVASNITARISEGLAVFVSDLTSDYYQEAPGDLFVDETSPALHALHPQINDFSTLAMPSLKVGYRYETQTAPTLSEWPRIYEFLAEHLGGE